MGCGLAGTQRRTFVSLADLLTARPVHEHNAGMRHLGRMTGVKLARSDVAFAALCCQFSGVQLCQAAAAQGATAGVIHMQQATCGASSGQVPLLLRWKPAAGSAVKIQ